MKLLKEKPTKSYKNEESFPTEGIKHDASKRKKNITMKIFLISHP